jgi:hypothetical protein
MKKFIGIIILVILEIITLFLFSKWDIITILGLWTIVYGTFAFKRLFKIDYLTFSATSRDYDTAKSQLKGDNVKSRIKEEPYIKSNIIAKWLYLTTTFINGGLCFYLIQAK